MYLLGWGKGSNGFWKVDKYGVDIINCNIYFDLEVSKEKIHATEVVLFYCFLMIFTKIFLNYYC